MLPSAPGAAAPAALPPSGYRSATPAWLDDEHALDEAGPPVMARTVAKLLAGAGYSLQGNAKTAGGSSTPTVTPSSGTSTPR